MMCPSCRSEDIVTVDTDCLGDDGETLSFLVCSSCDYGINEHTEDLCSCVKVVSSDD